MPFFGGDGGGAGDYKIEGTNIIGGNDVMPAIIGDFNMGLGNGSLQNAINSSANIAVGNNSLNTQTDALYNVSIGYQSLSEITTGSNNIAIGAYINKPHFSLGVQSDDINSSVLVGHIVASNRDATDPANHVISGSVAIGAQCLGFNATAIRSFIDNVCIGTNSQLNINSDISNSVAIGAYTTAASTGVSVGYLTSSANNAIAIGQSVTSVANQIKIGDASHTSVIIGGIDFSGGPGGGKTVQTAAASGVFVDFTVPANTRQITVIFDNVSTTGTTQFGVQLGDSGGIETTSYSGVSNSNGASNGTFSTGFFAFIFSAGLIAANNYSGSCVINAIDAANTRFNAVSMVYNMSSPQYFYGNGLKTLSNPLTTIRVFVDGGVKTFDGGTISIVY